MSLPINEKQLTVISGGQTGADIAGLVAAKKLGIHTTGWATKGFRTENGSKPILGFEYNLIQHASPAYPPRTEENVAASDVTIIFSPVTSSSGTAATIRFCDKHDKVYMVVSEFKENTYLEVLAFLKGNEPSVINIAGNRESISRGLSSSVKNLLLNVLRTYKADYPEMMKYINNPELLTPPPAISK